MVDFQDVSVGQKKRPVFPQKKQIKQKKRKCWFKSIHVFSKHPPHQRSSPQKAWPHLYHLETFPTPTTRQVQHAFGATDVLRVASFGKKHDDDIQRFARKKSGSRGMLRGVGTYCVWGFLTRKKSPKKYTVHQKDILY